MTKKYKLVNRQIQVRHAISPTETIQADAPRYAEAEWMWSKMSNITDSYEWIDHDTTVWMVDSTWFYYAWLRRYERCKAPAWQIGLVSENQLKPLVTPRFLFRRQTWCRLWRVDCPFKSGAFVTWIMCFGVQQWQSLRSTRCDVAAWKERNPRRRRRTSSSLPSRAWTPSTPCLRTPVATAVKIWDKWHSTKKFMVVQQCRDASDL